MPMMRFGVRFGVRFGLAIPFGRSIRGCKRLNFSLYLVIGKGERTGYIGQARRTLVSTAARGIDRFETFELMNQNKQRPMADTAAGGLHGWRNMRNPAPMKLSV